MRSIRFVVPLSVLLASACSGGADFDAEEVSRVSAALLSGTALFVAGSTSLNAADTAVRNRLQTMGLTVVVKSASAAVTADASGKVLVVISSTVSPTNVNTKFRTVAVPVLTWENQIYDDMGMTPTASTNFGTQSSQNSLSVVAGAPMSAGLSGTQTVASSNTFNWGKPNGAATVSARIVSDSTRAAIFGYASGAAMPGLTAPARRVGFFLGDSNASSLTTAGWGLFEAAVNWAVSGGAPPAGDADGDRLPDSVETNTGTYVSTTNTGTNPNNPDTDGDGIKDGDEVLGTTAGLNLPAFGVSPVRKNILIEYDWFVDSLECGSHSHRPTAASVAAVTTAFANAPVSNPNGTTGITIIHDYGQGGAFAGGNQIADADGRLLGTTGDSEYQNYKAANLAPNRVGYFHYTILPHQYGDASNYSSGYAQYNSDNMIVSLNCAGSDQNVGNTIMHELGHNLNLHHGGNNDDNWKPNYNSVMNYAFQFSGVDTNCVPGGDGLLDYSRNQRITLNENALIETAGICGSPGWDWNGNGTISSSAIAFDVNGEGGLMTLTDYDDWANLIYDFAPATFARTAPVGVACPAPPRP